MQSLLTASENNVLPSFLSPMGYPDDALTAREWALLSPGSTLPTSSDATAFVASPNSDHKEALAKATKDLMSLEPERWRLQSAMQNGQDSLRFMQPHAMPMEFHHRPQQSTLGLNASISFPQGKLQLDPQLANMSDFKPSTSSSSDSNLRSSPTNVGQHQTVPLQSSHRRVESSYKGRKISSTTDPQNMSSSPSRPELHPSSASSSSSSSSHSISKNTSSKRNRVSSSTSPTSSVTPSTTPTQKQSLLSPSQKKANHIQSEQKRRANIRRGYEALCETVPALREAIKQEEEEAAMMAEKMDGGPGRRRRRKGQGKDDREKVDGRAGPRSENVVLTKST